MKDRENLIKQIRYRVRSIGMREVQDLLEEKYLSRLDRMDVDELRALLELLRLDDWTLRRKLLER